MTIYRGAELEFERVIDDAGDEVWRLNVVYTSPEDNPHDPAFQIQDFNNSAVREAILAAAFNGETTVFHE